ncbi:unnamed protein product [Schistosoma margrebowiei]|uniref:DUF7041 domain-containing protein n=3 Tax=Schistosoma margrebowiei TaxID=48269 RepID=A0AA84ZCC2_9TREM|nr:unnamed protein product [Schistosoma margrebowiei]
MSDLKETHNLEDLSPVEIDTVMTTKSRLPEFDRSDPELWFAQLEHYFTRHNIKSEGIRYRDLCSILPPSVAKEVRDLILDPPSPQPYTVLRREIMNRLSLSDSQRIQRLFQGETLGDRSPSQFLRHLQVLVGDNTVGEAVLKQGWIQALPCYVQHCLDAQDPETSLSHLARIADRIMERGPPTGSGTINHTQKVESAKDPVIEGLIASVKSLTEAVTRMQMGHTNRSRSPQRSRSKSQNRSQMSRQSGQFYLKETHNLEDLSPVEIDTVMTTKSRLPEFDRSDPELWFAQLEHYFTRHNIKSEGIRYRDLCSILPPSVAKEVRDLILDPPSPQPYTVLRREIMNRLSLSDSQRIQRLFQGETLGDRSPSQFLRHLQVLVGDNTVGEAVLKQGWIQALPCYVQHCLDAQDPETSLSHLARIADRIMERGPPTGSGTINHTQKVESAKDPVIEGLIASVKSLTEAVTRMQMGHTNRSRSPQRSRSKSQNRSQMSRQSGQFCWYHWKFGVNSTKCRQPCAWPKHNSKTAGNE